MNLTSLYMYHASVPKDHLQKIIFSFHFMETLWEALFEVICYETVLQVNFPIDIILLFYLMDIMDVQEQSKQRTFSCR